MAVPSAVAKSAQNASEIGWAFVPQYYTFVNKDPSRLHCFYTKRSTLIHGTEGEEASPCFGQQEIHRKFLTLNFDDCKVFVSNVDSQSSADGGIIVQVLGEMSSGAGPWRKFAQTFFLAEQPNGFFVLNDIFRYMKEEEDEADEEPEAEPVTVTEDVAVSDASVHVPAPEAPPAYQAPAVSASPKPPVPEPAVTAFTPASSSTRPFVPAEPVAASESVGTQTGPPLQPNGIHIDSRDARSAEPSVDPSKSGSQPAPSTAGPVSGAEAAPSAGLAPSPGAAAVSPASGQPCKARPEAVASARSSIPPSAPSANGRTVSVQSKTSTVPPATMPGAPKPPEPSQPAAPKTWASLAASGKSAWGQSHLASSQGISSAPSAPPLSASDTQPPSSQNRQNGPPSHTHPDRHQPLDSISTGACFIKSVSEGLDEQVLREQLVKKFGPIRELDVIRSKACGFLEFERIDSAKKAIQMSMPFNMGGKGGIQIVTISGEEYVIHVESKRQPGERGRPADAGPKRGFGDRGGRPGGHFGGSSGGNRGRGAMDGGPRGTGGRGAGGPRGSGRGSK